MTVDAAGAGTPADGLARALDAYDRGDLEASRALCAARLAAAPDDAVALMLTGLILKRGSNFEEAIPPLERSIGIAPNAKALASLADCLLRVGRLDESLECIERVVAAHPDNLEALLLKSAILHAQRNFGPALDCVRRAESIAPDSGLVAARCGCILTELGDYDAAERRFRDAARLVPALRHCSLIGFSESLWREVAPPAAAAPPEEFAQLRPADVCAPFDAVVAACCDTQYFRKYGVTFVNSYARNAARRKLLHLHVVDPDEGLAGHLDELFARAGLRNVAVTFEYAPIDETPDFNLRRTFYSCARFLRMGSLLHLYGRTIACFDIDTVFEAPLDDLLAATGAADIGLIDRAPADSPWLDIIANVVIANHTEAAQRYFCAVANYVRKFLARGELFWHLDQIALYCVLKMMRRFDAPPSVAPIAAAAGAALWHIGNPYDYRLKEHRAARYRLEDAAP